MRVFLLLLLLSNIAFFAWTQYWAKSVSADSLLVQQQINRDAIRVLGPTSAASTRREPVKPGMQVACLRWSDISVVDAARADTQLAALSLGSRLTQIRVNGTAGWWVYMAPQGGREGAQKKAGELKRLGIEEFFILQDDAQLPFAISLGVFRTEEAARNRLEELRSRGVRTAQVGARTTPVQRVAYEVRAVDDALVAQLNELKAGYPGSELKECAKTDAPIR